MGDLRVKAPNGPDWSTFQIKDVLYAPAMSATLISLEQLDDAGMRSSIFNGTCLITRGLNGKVIARIPKMNGLYCVHHGNEALASATKSPISLFDLYRRLGHLSFGYLKKMLAAGSFLGINVNVDDSQEPECAVCLKMKATRAPIAKMRSSPRAAHYGDLLHMDIWSPSPVKTMHGF